MWRLLVDTGPDESWPALKTRLAQIPANTAGRRKIDLAIISHIDHDHIGGAAKLFSDRELGLSFGDVWFNAPQVKTIRGVAEGRSLAKLLGAAGSNLPWNKAWGGRHAVGTADAPFVELPRRAGAPRLTLLSPSPQSLAALFKVWDRELARLAASDEPAPLEAIASRGRSTLDLEALSARKTAVDRAPANGSSIAVLLEHKGVSVLLGADAYPTVLVPALKALAAHRGETLPLRVDVFKLSHHGSRANVTIDLLKAVQAQHYIVSTNGSIFGHPDDEAIARVILGGGDKPVLWFNYSTARTDKWAASDIQKRFKFEAHVPNDDSRGARLEIEP